MMLPVSASASSSRSTMSSSGSSWPEWREPAAAVGLWKNQQRASRKRAVKVLTNGDERAVSRLGDDVRRLLVGQDIDGGNRQQHFVAHNLAKAGGRVTDRDVCDLGDGIASMSEICITCPAASLRDLPEPQHVRALAPEIGRQDETAISRHVQIDQRDVHVLGLHHRNAWFEPPPSMHAQFRRILASALEATIRANLLSSATRTVRCMFPISESVLYSTFPQGVPDEIFRPVEPGRHVRVNFFPPTLRRPSAGPDVGPSPHDPSAHAPSNSSLAAIKAILRLGCVQRHARRGDQAAASTVRSSRHMRARPVPEAAP